MRRTFHTEHLLNAKECDQLLSLWGEDHGLGGEYEEGESYISKRTCVVEMPDPIYRKIKKAVERANKENWGYEGEYSRYTEIYRYQSGDFFDWHMDLGPKEIAKRKLSTLIQLSNPKDYDGGRLEIFGNEEAVAGTRRGTLMIYPSYVMHRVTKVTRGLRWSAGGELLGKPFR